eukprot:Skav210939  [mRNA]  locus=scaffold713:141408:145823:- [translate_table: standard]
MERHLFGTPTPRVGERFTGVLQLTHHLDESATVGLRIPHGEPVLLTCWHDLGRASFYGALIVALDDFLYLQIDGDTLVCKVEGRPSSHSDLLLELCGGFGGMGIGASFLGGIPHVTVDSNPLAAQHLVNNQHGTVLCLDLLDLGSARVIHENFQGQPGTTTLGFPCQPHSSQGSMKGSQDSRSEVFWAGLRVIFLCQSQAAILECVPAAGRHPDVLRGLQALADAMNYSIHTTELDLQAQWPNRRRRWWALLLPKHWNSVDLVEWPATGVPLVVGDIIKHWGRWSEQDEQDLHLTIEEFNVYQDPRFGQDQRLLGLRDVANTFLHSYGNALSSCPCGCRPGAFSTQMLEAKGLRGFFAPSRVTGGPRYLHYREVALLLGVPNQVNYGDLSAKACLALLAPEVWLHAYKQELLRQSAQLFHQEEPGILSHVTLRDGAGNELVIVSATACTVGQLLRAERITLDWNEAGGISHEGSRLPLGQYMDLTTGPFEYTVDPGPMHRYRPEGLLMIAIIHDGNYLIEFLQPGQFLFEALRPANIQANFLVDAGGQIYGADHRVWRSYRLRTLPNWPPTMPATLSGTGAPRSTLGLHDGHIWQVLRDLQDHIDSSQQPLLIHPREAFAMLNHTWNPTDSTLQTDLAASSGQICCIFVAEHHWALLWGDLSVDHMFWKYEDGIPHKLLHAAHQLASLISNFLQIPSWTLESGGDIQQVDAVTCGTVALCHAARRFGLFGLPSAEHVRTLHSWLLAAPSIGSLHGGGLTPEQKEALCNLLSEHGVPFLAVEDRAQQAIQKLGPGPIAEALKAKNSWAYLKALASKPSVSLRLVHADELTKHIGNNARQKFGASIPNAKNKKKQEKKGQTPPALVDPSLLVLTPGSFRDSEEDDVPQIEFQDVEAEAHGIAICSLDQGQQWLRTVKSISSSPLALLVTEPPPAVFMTQFEISPVTFTAIYKGTGEPMIIYGAMKTLGDMKINRVIPKSLTRPTLVSTQVMKIIVYRDEFEGSWERLVESPIRVLCQLVPRLQLCQGQDCGAECPKSHAPVDDSFDTVLMEIWSRSFAKLEGGKAPPTEAQIFWVFVRIPQGLVSSLLQVQCPGIYMEPRSAEKGHDELYRVIWLPSRTLADAQHACRTCLHALGLVRLRKKYGVRVLATNEEAAFKILRPDSTFVATQVQRVFQLFPLPHGLQKAGIQKLLTELGWVAKPLQPGRSNAQAMSWHVGASSAPPKEVFTAFDHEVIVTELTKENKPKPPPRYLASNKTQRHVQQEASSSSAGPTSTPATDPWLDGSKDPWHAFFAQQQPSGKKHIEEVSSKLRDEMTSALKQEMETIQQNSTAAASTDAVQQALATQEQRVQRLETTMGEMKAQNQQFTQWFGEIGQQIQSNESSIQTIQYTLSTHQAELTGLHSEVQAVPDRVSRSIQSTLSEDFAKRFDQLEALMEKKLRTE